MNAFAVGQICSIHSIERIEWISHVSLSVSSNVSIHKSISIVFFILVLRIVYVASEWAI